jgi:hypothetical protein
MAETQKEKIMRILGVSDSEADDILASDKAIDQGKRVDFDLSPEQEKLAKKFANAGTRKAPTVYKFDQRKRKENPTKAAIIAEIATFLTENSENACENVEITNKERQISFKIGSESYELTLVQKRKPKS